MAWIPAGTFAMGSAVHYPEERPVRRVSVSSFWIDVRQVGNADFARFVEETGYVTAAERPLDPAAYPGCPPQLLVPGSMVFRQPAQDEAHSWWHYVPGADWRHPEGPHSTIAGMDALPVVHVTIEDAEAYAAWSGKSLPTEAQWEYAARGGLDGAAYAWGEDPAPGGSRMANIWEGDFPFENLKDRRPGPEATGSYPPNGYGLYDMIGNVWEWTRDWYTHGARRFKERSCCVVADPRGGSREESLEARGPAAPIPRKVLKGGSFLCAAGYCARYRPAARQAQPIDTPASNIGFRCVRPGNNEV